MASLRQYRELGHGNSENVNNTYHAIIYRSVAGAGSIVVYLIFHARNMPQSTPKYHLSRCAKYGPPQRSDDELRGLEKSFVLDCVFVATLSDDSGRANPKMATAIPPYNAQKDAFAKNYFDCDTVKKVLRKTGQNIDQGESLCGKQMDRFYYNGTMGTHIQLRNQNGAGNAQQTVRGHGMFMESPKPIVGHHGLYGFRRNTPWLRQKPSVFIGKIDNRSLVP